MNEKYEYLTSLNDEGNPNNMDAYHVIMIHDFVMATNPGHVVEIGPNKGYSTTALVEAVRHGWKGQASLVDIYITDELRALVGKEHQFALLQMSGADGLNQAHYNSHRPVEVVIIDGNHNWRYVKEEYDVCRRIDVKTIIAHDVCEGEDGPRRMLDAMIESKEWHISVDAQKRAGMRTERGLMFATKK